MNKFFGNLGFRSSSKTVTKQIWKDSKQQFQKIHFLAILVLNAACDQNNSRMTRDNVCRKVENLERVKSDFVKILFYTAYKLHFQLKKNNNNIQEKKPREFFFGFLF